VELERARTKTKGGKRNEKRKKDNAKLGHKQFLSRPSRTTLKKIGKGLYDQKIKKTTIIYYKLEQKRFDKGVRRTLKKGSHQLWRMMRPLKKKPSPHRQEGRQSSGQRKKNRRRDSVYKSKTKRTFRGDLYQEEASKLRKSSAAKDSEKR